MELLGRHVVDGAEEVAGGRQLRVGAGEAGEPEVRQVGVLAAQQDVRGLDVAVHEPGGVRGVERARDLVDDRRGARRLEPPLGAQQPVQVGAGDPAHHEVQPPVLLARLVDRDHVRVIDRRRHPRLALEALAEVAVGGVLGRDQLERDRASQRDLGRAVDDAHAAAAGDRLDTAARDMSALEHVGHPSMLTRMSPTSGRDRIRADLERLVRDPVDRVPGLPARAARRGGRDRRRRCSATRASSTCRTRRRACSPSIAGPGPTVLLYAHYDVQPAPPDGWDERSVHARRCATAACTAAARPTTSPGSSPTSRRCGRTASRPHVKVLIEGSEENGRQKLLEVVDRDPELMRADLFVIADGGNWRLGEPTLCETLRGHGKLTVTLRTLENALHSGQFGGAAPDALLALTRMLATLHDDDGAVAVEGLAGRRLGGRRPARGGLPPPGRRARRRRARRHRHRSPTACGRATRSPCSASTRPPSRARATS